MYLNVKHVLSQQPLLRHYDHIFMILFPFSEKSYIKYSYKVLQGNK